MGQKIDRACELAIRIANDPASGYSQRSRWGPDYDCSSLVITCFEDAGIPVKTRGASWTGNMKAVFTACGFQALPYPDTLIRGDVLLNEIYHTALYIGDGKLVEACIAETGDVDGQSGDQTSHEIHVRDLYEYYRGWQWILRYPEHDEDPVQVDHGDVGYNYNKWYAAMCPEITMGSFGPVAAAVEAMLNYHGFGYLAVDGHISSTDRAALRRFQARHRLDDDGVVGPKTWYELTRWN